MASSVTPPLKDLTELESSRPAVSLRRTVLSRALLLAGGSSLVVTLGFVLLGMFPLLERIAENEFRLASERVEARLRQTFEPEERLLEISLGWVGSAGPDIDQPDDFNHFFKPLLKGSPYITSIVAGTSSGQGWMLLQRDDGSWRNRLSDVVRWGRQHRFIDTDARGVEQSRWETLDYDARSRPWFVGAVSKAAPGSVHWTPPYVFFTTGDPGITVSRKVMLRDGRDFVLGFDLKLRDLSSATLNARVGEKGLALIMTDDERTLGLPRRPVGVSEDDWLKRVLQPVDKLGVDAVSAALNVWRDAGRRPFGVQHFSVEGRAWLASARTYPLGEQTFWVLTFAPAADFAPEWFRIGLGLGGGLLALLLIAAGVAHVQARIIAAPLETLVESSRRIGELDFSTNVQVTSPIAEIAQLSRAQEHMRKMLQRNQHALRDHAERLNAQVRELRDAEDRINTLAFYDPLTGLPNRRLLSDRLQRALTHCMRSNQMGALLFLDLDNFKTLNDTLGHDLGDKLLKEVAVRLSSSVRQDDTAARLGGDEFVVVLEDLGYNQDEASERVAEIGNKILGVLSSDIVFDTYPVRTSASIGATLFSGPSVSVDELFKQADLAMYQAKADGRNRLRFFGPEMLVQLSQRAAMENDLRRALVRDQFELYFQPQVSSAGGVQGVEALLRWQHPQRGLVSPFEFISVAEDAGLIVEIGRWVLVTACRRLAAWSAEPRFSSLCISVNVSAKQFRHAEFCDEVKDVLSRTGARPELLRLELTESLLLDDVEVVIARMQDLRSLGVSFSLDDFGTGYSSLSYLKRLPLTELKIDKSFVRDVLIDPNDAAIAETIVALGHTMGLSVIAEGVETEAQRSFLAHAGCDAYQGYLFGRPMPHEQLQLLLRSGFVPQLSASADD